jgi:secretion/DNA translocation related CpaE-like protein
VSGQDNRPGSATLGGMTVIGVIGACGGAGASVLSAMLAGTAISAGSALLIDCDPCGGGIDVLLGCERVDGPRWSQVQIAGGRLDPVLLMSALPRWGRVPFLAVDRGDALGPESVATVLRSGGEAGTVIADLPRWRGTLQQAAVELCDRVILVVPAEVRAAAAGALIAASLPPGRTVLAVRGRSSELTPGHLQDCLGIPLVGAVPFDAAVAHDAGLSMRGLRRRTRDALWRLLAQVVDERAAA